MNEVAESIIDIRHLTKSYGKARGVTDLSLEVGKGEVFAFLGPNGAGKSTTIRSILGLIHFESGSISVFGMDAVKKHEPVLQRIGYMPSEAWFPTGLSVGDVLKLTADVRGVDCAEEAGKLCERLKVDSGRKISELSLGNRKKVSIVCAMQHKPELFIFDEPTGGLDPLMQKVFFQLIREYVDAGATCLLSTHVLSEVRNYCDRVAIMKEGRLVAADTVENLTSERVKRIRMIRDGEQLDFLYRDDLNELYKELEGHDIQDILIEEPSIEEVFMKFYRGDTVK